MRQFIIITISILSYLGSFAQISLDTIAQYNGLFDPTVMICDSSGNVLVGGNGGQLPVLAKFHPDTGLSWSYSYPIQEGDQALITAISVDPQDNIYCHLYAQFDHFWVEKFSSKGSPTARLSNLSGNQIFGYIKYGRIDYLSDNRIRLLTQEEDSADAIRYYFDTTLTTIVQVDTFALGTHSFWCQKEILGDEQSLIFNGEENGEFGVYDLSDDITFNPFSGHTFINGGFDLIDFSDNLYYALHNNDTLTGDNDTFIVYNPEIAIFDQNWNSIRSNQPFFDTVNNGNSIVRPIVRDVIYHKEYGIILCGEYYSGTSTTAILAQFIAQIDPATLEVSSEFVQESNRFFTHLSSFGDNVYIIDEPRGFPSGMNLFKLNLQKITGVEEAASAASPSFTVYPNPTTGQLTIHIDPTVVIEAVNIYDLSGRLVYQGASSINQPIQISQAGTYLVQVHTATGVATQKVMVTQ